MTTMNRIRPKYGDIFRVPLDEKRVGYIQYVADDESMLGSNVIRAYSKLYDSDNPPDLSVVTSGEIHFHAHVLLKAAMKFFSWVKVGNAACPKEIDVLFRGTWDHGNPDIEVSKDWYVWKINEPFQNVGILPPQYQDAELGAVKAPPDIADRMRTGSYSHFSHGY